jgi:penicillin-binding protein 1A
MTGILRDVVLKGTGRGVDFGRPVAGKTGTTSDYKDAWFVGFSPSIATGVYVGYDLPRTIYEGASGGPVAGPIFKQYMMKAYEGRPVEDFTASPEVKREIEAEERMNILAELQTNPAGAAATLAQMRSGRTDGPRVDTRPGSSIVIEDTPAARAPATTKAAPKAAPASAPTAAPKAEKEG